jgi:hypothetical protein
MSKQYCHFDASRLALACSPLAVTTWSSGESSGLDRSRKGSASGAQLASCAQRQSLPSDRLGRPTCSAK